MRTKTEIVILNWNGAGHLRRFLPSVLASVPEGVGVVVADNGSTDDSLGVLEREFPAVGRIVLDRNYGFAGSIRMSKRLPDGSNRSSKRSIGIGPWLP